MCFSNPRLDVFCVLGTFLPVLGLFGALLTIFLKFNPRLGQNLGFPIRAGPK
jgi:hypothetical protein